MADERLVATLGAWLRDSDVPPPDAPMSASRAMAGIEVTTQLGRLWPPARLAPKAKPAPALGAFGPAGPPPRSAPRVQRPAIRAKVGKAITPRQALSLVVVAGFIGGAVLIGASLLPSGPNQAAAIVVPASASAAWLATPGATPRPTPVPTPEPTPTPFPTWPPSEHALDWHGGGVRMEADALKVRLRGKLFNAPGEVLTRGATSGDHAQLETTWYEGDVEQRLVVELGLDDSHWWISQFRTYDGYENGAWVDFAGLVTQTRTPLGEPYTGDLRLDSTGAQRKAMRKGGSARLRLDGLRISAFGPGTRPAPPMGCGYLEDPRVADDGWSGQPLQEPGEPLEGLLGMSPAQAETILIELGLCYRFDYSWSVPELFEDPRLNERIDAGRERRCSAPPTGEVRTLGFEPADPPGTNGAMVIVEVVDPDVRDLPEPPPAGTDCPTL